jgi:signal transduction histidine kinase
VTEFTDLNASLDTLMQGSLASYRQQKEFTENASHELQTPLAIVKSRLDMLLQSQSLDAGQMRIVEQVYQAINRVSRINKNLLLLARIEHAQFEEKERIALGEMLATVAAQFSDRFENSALHYAENIEPFAVEANPVLTEILLTNLLVNAVRYTPAGGNVLVELNGGILTVSNSGAAALQAESLFRRFAQASGEHAGSGLGLAIAREICERCGWQISYDFSSNMHRFSVRF